MHRMEPELDTGPVVAQRPIPLGEFVEPQDFYARMGPIVMEVLAEALDRLAAGEQGRAQQAGGEYESFFTDEDAWLDTARPAKELHRLVWAWRYTLPVGELHGALVDLDGEVVRVLRSSLTEIEGARRLECADGPIWLVEAESAQAAAAGAASTGSS